ncbi:MAG: hypothetical protein CVV24_14490 [Ignavibacteriae bacterium HGW-Ignavibacteriae-3]|nr:MAG: hypothetical protein CVV24_14490 [Ignavibacteriae bacterium HGW-Ignavibacteriae-3]
MMKLRSVLKIIEWEAVLWLVGLIYLLFINPYASQHFTLCPFDNLGITFCPGCGLGRSISFFYQGDLIHSIKTHPLGIIAFGLISIRIIRLVIKMINNYHKSEEVLYG